MKSPTQKSAVAKILPSTRKYSLLCIAPPGAILACVRREGEGEQKTEGEACAAGVEERGIDCRRGGRDRGEDEHGIAPAPAGRPLRCRPGRRPPRPPARPRAARALSGSCP